MLPEPLTSQAPRPGGLPGDLDAGHARRTWGLVWGLGAIAVVCLLLGHVYVSGDGMMSAALAAALVAHLSSRPSPRELVATVAIAVALLAVRSSAFALGGIAPPFDRLVSALGLASLIVQVAALVLAPPVRWTSTRGGFVALTMLSPMFSLAFASGIALPGVLRGDLYDGIVLHFDRALFGGHTPAVVVGQWLVAHPWLVACAQFSYWAPQPLNILVFVAERRRRSRYDVITTLFIAVFAGYAFFPFFPVVGPGYVLPGFPYVAAGAPAVMASIPVSVPRNCMPSLHMGGALIIAVHTWRLGGVTWRALGIVDVILTIIATLGFGYHYAADLLAVLPFTYGVLAIERRDLRGVIVGFGVTVAFLVFLRYGLG